MIFIIFIATPTQNPSFQTHNPLKNHFAILSICPTFVSERSNGRERNRSLLYFSDMANLDKTSQIRELVESLLSVENQYFIVKISIRPIHNISVFIDGDQGVTIEKCVQLNRALYKKIVETEVCKDGEFSLEVSSPGVDEPLVLPRQFVKNIGRNVEVEMLDGRKMEGKLLTADDQSIQLEEEKGKGKKKEIIQHFLLLTDIKSTIVKLIFK